MKTAFNFFLITFILALIIVGILTWVSAWRMPIEEIVYPAVHPSSYT